MLDPLGVVKKTRTAMEEESEIDAAPTTITSNEGLQGQKVDDISFKPVIVDFPEIAVPDFLPNLPGSIFELFTFSAFSSTYNNLLFMNHLLRH